MKHWQKRVAPCDDDRPYIYLAFAEADGAKVWKLMRLLLVRGCRVWYSYGPAGNAVELRRRQERSGGAALTVLYLTDAACADKDTKSNILVNQKLGRPILCLDPDGTDRRLAMGLREDIEHIPLYQMKDATEIENAIIHAEGFSQDVIGPPMAIAGGGLIKRLTLLFCALALVLGAVGFAGYRYLNWFRPAPQDEIQISDPVILSAVRETVLGGVITESAAAAITSLRLDALPESWDELSLLPSLERIELPQQALLGDEALPDGGYIIELNGG